jgi:hypothetical protein
MKQENFTYNFTSSKTPGEVFQLLTDPCKWWSGFYEETIKGKSEELNDEFTFKAGGGAHYSKQKLTELIPDKKIVWAVTDSKLTFLKDTGEWTGTRICFDISTGKDNTEITFTHEGLVPQIECYDQCSAGWTSYLGKLKQALR